MTSLFFGVLSNAGVPADENAVRRNTAPVIIDESPAEQDAAPDFNEVETDSNPNLGLDPRQLASHWHEGEQYRPFWIEDVDRSNEYNDIVDRQVSSSGTAAAREAAGIYGHGTLKYAEGIEPVQDLRQGGKMGNEYFVRNDRTIQETMSHMVAPPINYDQSTTVGVNALGKDATQRARNASMYSAFLFGAGGAA